MTESLSVSAGPVASRANGEPEAGRFPIVGIGASAGGLDACRLLLGAMPTDSGCAFVVVQHLDPQHDSALTDILGRATAMTVVVATDNLRVRPNHVYVIPPNSQLEIHGGVLMLQSRDGDASGQGAIDHFFESLAADRQEQAIGVVLSGNASDGTLGLEAIRAEGGVAFAQDATAKYGSMPRSAIAAGCVDFVLPPAEIAATLARLAQHPAINGTSARSVAPHGSDDARMTDSITEPVGAAAPRAGEDAASLPDVDREAFAAILQLVRERCGVDFSHYKFNTIHRRVMRRMVLCHQPTLALYATFLRDHAAEAPRLFGDLLINVTGFFRNPAAFEALARQVFPRLLEQRTDEPVRVWVLGCSTGQEAYSVAMAFAEVAQETGSPRRLQVFATDLAGAALSKARDGFFSAGAVQNVSPERLQRFFVAENGGYRIAKALREQVVFARQNFLSDPPFSHLDLICCRNLLIYLDGELQQRAIPTFHYALNPGGFLFLGASESIGRFADLFVTIDGPHRIFMKQAAAGAVVLPTGERSYQRLGRVSASGGSAGPVLRYREGSVQRDAQREAERVILNRYAPPSVLIGPERQVLHFRGDVDGYLRIQPGRASFDLLKMARDGLQAPLRSALEQSARENGPVRSQEIVVRVPGGERRIELEVVPLINLRESYRLILFHEAGTASPVRAISAEPVGDSVGRVAQLERELADARDYLQSVMEQQEAAQQELEASNEESQSANEELQSLVEELETSKEELQATNEELTTVNEELGQRLKQVSELNGDLNNLQAATNLAVVLLGPDLVVRRFTPPAKRLFGLHASDVGQPLRLASLPVAGLKDFVAAACAGVGETTHEMADEQGRWHALRVRPYLNTEGAVDGAVLMMTDIDELKRTEIRIAGEREHAEAIVQAVPSPLVILSAELNLVSANDAFYRTFQLAPAEAVGRNFFAIDNGVWESVRLRKVLRELSSQADFFSTLELGHHFPRLGARTLLIDARVLGARVDFPREIVLSIQDVTDVLAFQVGLRRSELRYRRLFEAAREGVLLVEPSSRKVIDANSSIAELLDCPGENLKGRELHEIGLLPSQAEADDLFRRLREDGQVRYPSLPLRAKAGGSEREVELAGALYREQDDSVVQFHVRDITERKRTARLEAIVREGEQQYRSLFNAIDEGFAVIELQAAAEGAAEDFVFLETNPSFAKQSGLGEVAGRSIRDVAPLLEPRWFSLFSKVAQSGVPVRLEAEAMGIWWDALVFRLGEAGSRQVALLLTDTTDRHAAEVQLREVQRQLADRAGELEKLVTERTAELTATNKQLEEFVYSIAHDLRAPLRSMQVFSAMLLDEAPNRDAAGREYIERINKSAEFMDALLRDLLAFSKVSQQRVELEAVPLGEAVDLALSTLAEEIQVRHATVDAVGPWPNVQAHQPTVTQVLLNLIGNALKFARPGESPRVRVYAEEHDATVRLCVEDAGIGIAPEHQEQIFRLFTRLHGGKFAGTGVGLSIVQKGIERLGGKVGVKSGAGQGSCFWFELPRVKSNSKDLC